MPSKRLRLKAPTLGLDVGDLIGEAIRGSTSRTDALRRYRAKGGKISDARWYGRREKGKGKAGRPQHSSVYGEARAKGLDSRRQIGRDDPSWRGVPREHEMEDAQVAPYVRAKYEQFVELIGEETEEALDAAGRRRSRGAGILITKVESLTIPYKVPKPASRTLKSKRWVEGEILRKYLESAERRQAAGSRPLKIIAVRYLKTHRNVPRERRRKRT